MLTKKTITYTDYNGTERTEDYYFNLSKLELTRMQASVEGGLDEKLKKMINAKNGKAVMDFFEELILKAYGEKSEDGRRFIKSEELSIAFSQTPAYEALFEELVTDDEAAANFVKSIIPKLPENK